MKPCDACHRIARFLTKVQTQEHGEQELHACDAHRTHPMVKSLPWIPLDVTEGGISQNHFFTVRVAALSLSTFRYTVTNAAGAIVYDTVVTLTKKARTGDELLGSVKTYMGSALNHADKNIHFHQHNEGGPT